MLRISRLSDYGVVISTRLAETGALCSVTDLAGATGIPKPTVSKILKTLSKAGLVRSVRGPHGGYGLVRPATEIAVGDVVTALEGPIGITECVVGDDPSCEYVGRCGVQANWQRINEVIAQALRQVSLAEMCTPLIQLRAARGPTSPPIENHASETPVKEGSGQ